MGRRLAAAGYAAFVFPQTVGEFIDFCGGRAGAGPQAHRGLGPLAGHRQRTGRRVQGRGGGGHCSRSWVELELHSLVEDVHRALRRVGLRAGRRGHQPARGQRVRQLRLEGRHCALGGGQAVAGDQQHRFEHGPRGLTTAHRGKEVQGGGHWAEGRRTARSSREREREGGHRVWRRGRGPLVHVGRVDAAKVMQRLRPHTHTHTHTHAHTHTHTHAHTHTAVGSCEASLEGSQAGSDVGPLHGRTYGAQRSTRRRAL